MLDKPPSDRADTTVYDNLITDLRTSRRAHDLRSCITNHERITTSVLKKKRKDIRNIGEDIHRCYLERGSQ